WQARLGAQSEKVLAKIQQDFAGYSQALADNRAFMQTMGLPSVSEFRQYTESSELLRRFPGLQGIAFTQALSPDKISEFEKRMRAQGYEEFKVWPEGERHLYTAISLIQPEDWRNKR